MGSADRSIWYHFDYVWWSNSPSVRPARPAVVRRGGARCKPTGVRASVEEGVRTRASRPAIVVVVLEAASVVCLGAAMALYPGGAEHAPHASGHSFWLNYLCDLSDSVARNGAPNPGAPWARASMALLLVALAAIFAFAPRAFGSRALVRLARAAGALFVAAALGVPLSGWLGSQVLHDASVLAAGPLGLLASAAVVIGLAKRDRARIATALGAFTLAASALGLALYAYCWSTGGSTIALPIGQRIALVSLLAWMLAVALLLAFGSDEPARCPAAG